MLNKEYSGKKRALPGTDLAKHEHKALSQSDQQQPKPGYKFRRHQHGTDWSVVLNATHSPGPKTTHMSCFLVWEYTETRSVCGCRSTRAG